MVGVTAGDPQPGARMGPLTWEELEHDVIVASHFSPVVGIYNLEGSVRRGFLPRLETIDWTQPVIISADANRQVILLRARVQAALWTLSRLPYFALAIFLADAWFSFAAANGSDGRRISIRAELQLRAPETKAEPALKLRADFPTDPRAAAG